MTVPLLDSGHKLEPCLIIYEFIKHTKLYIRNLFTKE